MPALFMLLIGCSPKGRNTEQHDVFFGIGENIREVLPHAIAFWPEAKGSMHIDAWRAVTRVNGFAVTVSDKPVSPKDHSLFFLNLGGYKRGEFEEFHYKMLVAAKDKNEAMKQAKQTAFFKHTGFKGATAHIDDKYGIDVDNVFLVKDIQPAASRSGYHLQVQPAGDAAEDVLHLGYFRLDRVDSWAGPALPLT